MSETVIHIENDVPSPDNGWAPAKVERLREWQERCKIQSFAHMMAGDHYGFMFMALNIPNIVLTATATLFSGAALLSEDNALPLTLIALLSTASATILAGILQSVDPSQIAAAHASISAGYDRVVLQINAELVNDVHERINGVRFVRQISNSMTQLATGSTQIPLRIWNRMKRQFRDLDVGPSPISSLPAITLVNGVAPGHNRSDDLQSSPMQQSTTPLTTQERITQIRLGRAPSHAVSTAAAIAAAAVSLPITQRSVTTIDMSAGVQPDMVSGVGASCMDIATSNTMPRFGLRPPVVRASQDWLFDFQNNRNM